jgi:hypothetical protein
MEYSIEHLIHEDVNMPWIVFLIVFVVAIILLFYLRKSKKTDNVISIKMSTTNNYEISRSDILLKEATVKKKEKDWDSAIALLREAYAEIQKEGIEHSINTYLRLPLFLADAGRRDEAWAEFNRLLTDVSNENPELIPMSHSQIYDKMRLSLQREGRSIEAVRLGVFSYLSWAKGLAMQKREEELIDYKSRESIAAMVKPLLKKAKKEQRQEAVEQIVQAAMLTVPHISFSNISNELAVILADE